MTALTCLLDINCLHWHVCLSAYNCISMCISEAQAEDLWPVMFGMFAPFGEAQAQNSLPAAFHHSLTCLHGTPMLPSCLLPWCQLGKSSLPCMKEHLGIVSTGTARCCAVATTQHALIPRCMGYVLQHNKKLQLLYCSCHGMFSQMACMLKQATGFPCLVIFLNC